MENQEQPRKEPVDFRTKQGSVYPEDYAPPRRSNGGTSKGYLSVLMVLLIVISGGLSYFITQTFAPSIQTVDVIAGQVNQHEQTLNNDESGLVKRLENVIASLGNYAKKTDLASYITSGQLSSYITSSQASTIMEGLIASAIAGLESDIEAAQTAIAELEELVASGGSETPVSGEIKSGIKYIFPSMPFTLAGNHIDGQGQFRLEITNDTNAIANDVQVAVYFTSSVSVAYTATPVITSSVVVGETPILWQYNSNYLGSNVILFANGLGLTLAPGETKTLLLTLDVEGDLPAGVTSVNYTPSTFLFD